MNKTQLATVRKETSQRMASMRKRLEQSRATHIAIGSTSAVLTGAALGEAERRGVSMIAYGVPVRPAVALLAAGGALMTKGATSAALVGAAFASAGVYGYEAAQKRSFIAGTVGSHVHSRMSV
jgi:hypothetical protein